MPIDPQRDAARADLADLRLADRVFAPHYAKALMRRLAHDADLRNQGGDVIAALNAGDAFEVLEIGRDLVWGIAPALDRVGYVAADALQQ